MNPVIFNAANHTYTNTETGELYTSCTQFLSKFKKKFDSEKYSKLVATRDGVSQEDVLAQWKKTNSDANDFGHALHKALEFYIRGEEYDKSFTTHISDIKKIHKFSIKKCEAEKLLWNHDYKLAGTADVIEFTKDGYFSVYDFKTNKSFNYTNKYDEYLLHPVAYLTNCEYNVYCLQLSVYAYMMEKMYGIKLYQMFIYYFDKKTNIWSEIPVPYMKAEVMLMFKFFIKSYE